MTLEALLSPFISRDGLSDILVREGEPIWTREHGSVRPNDGPRVTRELVQQFLAERESELGFPFTKFEEQLGRRGDLDFGCKIGKARFRCNTYRTNGRKLAMALRRLQDTPPALKDLDVPNAWLELSNRSKGLLLVTGATGSGKTTTLAATLEHINRTRHGHVITLEDPVEYMLTSKGCLVDQRQIGTDTKDFHTGLRAALREDPDVLFIGEMRDKETVEIALSAANTGHLVLATLHTINARQSVERIVSFYGADERDAAQQMLSQVLVAVLSQVLIPSRDRAKGRVLATELMVNTSGVANAIREGKTQAIFAAMDTGVREGHRLLNQSLHELVRKGTVSETEALYFAYDAQRLKKELGHV